MKVGIVACSNGLYPEKKVQLDALEIQLKKLGIQMVLSPHLYSTDRVAAGTAAERAEDLMAFYRDETIGSIFDVSGGDIANEVLSLLDYKQIAASGKLFWGYSDLTTVINAIYAKTGMYSVLYQIRNIVRTEAKIQQERFKSYVEANAAELSGDSSAVLKQPPELSGDSRAVLKQPLELSGDSSAVLKQPIDLFDIQYEFLQGSHMSGIVVGGNVRCLLKLAGTPYWPDMSGQILFLEALGGEEGQLATYFSQLEQIGVFDQVAGILLGTFTRFEEIDRGVTVYEMLRGHLSKNMPIAKTPDVGHGADAKALRIGGYLELG